MLLLLLCLGRSIHVLTLRRLLLTGNRIRRTLLLLLLVIESLLSHALVMCKGSLLLLIMMMIMTSILLVLLTRRGLTGPFAGPIVGLGLIAGSQPTARRTEAATLIQIVAAILVVAVNILLAALVVVAVVAADDALPLRFRGDGADAAVVLAGSSISWSSRLRVISPISTCAAATSTILLSAARERRGGLVDHPGNVAAHAL